MDSGIERWPTGIGGRLFDVSLWQHGPGSVKHCCRAYYTLMKKACMMTICITSHGAKSEQLCTDAIQSAIDAVSQTGGVVVVPPGVWYTGTVWLKSHVELHLEKGAVLRGTNRPEDYPSHCPVQAGHVISRRAFDRRMIYGCAVEDVAVTGEGTIDGAGGCADHSFKRGNEGRPTNLQFVACQDVKVSDVHLRCAGSWMQQYLACEHVSIHGIRVWNHGNRTNDGLDVDGCANVRISHCDIDSHDDALVFKSTGPESCRNIVVEGCRLHSNCHGIKFGTESVGGFENIRIANCLVTPSRLADPMSGYPEGRPVITGCALECTDGGVMRGISIAGLIVENVLAPIFIKLGDRHDRRIPGEDFDGCGVVEDIHISDVFARNVGPVGCSITGYPAHPVRNISLHHIRMHCCGGLPVDQVLTEVPENSNGYPEINMFTKINGRKTNQQLPAWGLFVRHAENIVLRDLDLHTDQPDARAPIVSGEAVTGFDLSAIRVNGQPYLPGT